MNGYGGLMHLKMLYMKSSPTAPTGNGSDLTPIKLYVDIILNIRWRQSRSPPLAIDALYARPLEETDFVSFRLTEATCMTM